MSAFEIALVWSVLVGGQALWWLDIEHQISRGRTESDWAESRIARYRLGSVVLGMLISGILCAIYFTLLSPLIQKYSPKGFNSAFASIGVVLTFFGALGSLTIAQTKRSTTREAMEAHKALRDHRYAIGLALLIGLLLLWLSLSADLTDQIKSRG